MTQGNLTRSDLSQIIADHLHIPRTQAQKILEDILETMTCALVQDDLLKIPGFGTFYTRMKKERLGRNPKTGQGAPITARRVTGFKASHLMTQSMK